MEKTFIVILFIISLGCEENKSTKNSLTKNDLNHFDSLELGDDSYKDSRERSYFSKALILFHEPSLKDTTNKNETIRMTVDESILYNLYCIRIERTDTMYIVTINIAPDEGERTTGLNGFLLKYESDFSKMDSIFSNLKSKINAFNIFRQNNSLPEKAANAVRADGATYILEYYVNGKYKVINRWNGFLEDDIYINSKEFLAIVKEMDALVPPGFLPDLNTAKTREDFKFPIFKRRH